ncbi:MAG: hypothetical protein WC346_15030, partial [Methanogenium sp.]
LHRYCVYHDIEEWTKDDFKKIKEWIEDSGSFVDVGSADEEAIVVTIWKKKKSSTKGNLTGKGNV